MTRHTTAREHADTVREALHLLGPDDEDAGTKHEGQLNGYAALDALLAEVERLEGERDGARQACEKAIRERHSLERKEDDWHSGYERSERRLKAAEALAERRASALRVALDCKGGFSGLVSERGGRPAVCTKCEATIRAALAVGGQGDSAP